MSAHIQRVCNTVFAAVGTVIALAADPSECVAQPEFATLHSFNGTDGFGPMAGIIESPDGALYGTTSRGGSASLGTVFRFDRSTQELTTLHDFTGSDGSVLYSGLTFGRDGFLYGTTYAGGTADLGTLFRVGSDGDNFVSLYSFDGADGAHPEDLKITQGRNGAFYGATSEGGISGGGTLFQFDANTRLLTTRHSFESAGIGGIGAGLITGRDGYWYGTTYSGGANNLGSVFRFDPSTFELTTLYEFAGADGANPVPGALIQGRDGILYGTTQLGANGKVYALNPDTLAFTTLHTFTGTYDGRMPLGGVAEGIDGYLYGTTVLGGQGYGTVFRVHPITHDYNIVFPFSGGNGRSPSGNLLRASDGSLYGVTRLGGSFNGGTIYKIGFADTTPPLIVDITARPNVLWPHLGKIVPVNLTVAAHDVGDPAPFSRIIGVTCNQRASGDWVITGDLTLTLRARNTGKTARVYTITVQCTDVSGNSANGTVDVTVPH